MLWLAAAGCVGVQPGAERASSSTGATASGTRIAIERRPRAIAPSSASRAFPSWSINAKRGAFFRQYARRWRRQRVEDRRGDRGARASERSALESSLGDDLEQLVHEPDDPRLDREGTSHSKVASTRLVAERRPGAHAGRSAA